MKLASKYNRFNILATIVVLMVAGVAYYFILHLILLSQLDSEIKLEEQEIKDFVINNKKLPNPSNYKDQKITFTPTEIFTATKITSKNIYNQKENAYSRILTFSLLVNTKNYRVTIVRSQEETEDLLQLVVTVTVALVALLLCILFVINRFVLNKLWHPFNTTLAELKKFDVSQQKILQFPPTNINEFKELNNAVIKMSDKVVKDYEALKSFTENASHEIQTPLAIINSRLELLVQSENFTETQMQDLQTIHNEISRLSKLNQSLLLLTKLDNNQFGETKQIQLQSIIDSHLNNYEELFSAKKISVTKTYSSPLTILMNDTMAQVLISNLITNAIKHNIENGTLAITINENILQICNTGNVLQHNPANMFERFKKDKVNSESLGLGLSIVKKICDRYHFIIDYTTTNNQHIITIQF